MPSQPNQPHSRKNNVYLLHLVLMPVFFVLKMMSDYNGLYHTANALKWGAIYISGSVLLFGLCWLTNRNRFKSATQTQVVLTLFFYFGYLHGLLKQAAPDAFIAKYAFVLPAVIVLALVALWRIRKTTGTNLLKLNQYLLLLYAVFMSVEGIKALQSKKAVPVTSHTFASKSAQAVYPNVYFLIFDEYPSSVSLQEKHGFRNPLDSFLTARQFFISRSSSSSYDMTPLSMGSTLSMNFLPLAKQEERLSRLYLTGVTAVQHNPVFKQFKALDYEIINNSIFDIDGYPCLQKPRFTYFNDYIFYYQTLWGKIHDDIWFNVVLHPTANKIYDFKKAEQQKEMAQFTNIMTLPLNRLKTLSLQTPEKPTFQYAHVVSPHLPLVYDRNGRFDSAGLIKPYRAEAFIEQVLYINTQIESIITNIQASNAGKPYVIILQGDHGEGESLYSPTYGSIDRYKNLNAYYYSDGDYTGLYDGISSVNTFRAVFNKYFQAGLPMLPDSSVYIKPK